MRRRVVISGLGCVSAMGWSPTGGVAPFWDGLLSARTAIARPTRVNLAGFPCQLGAEIPSFSARDAVPKSYRKAVKVMARDTEIAVAAAKEAFENARIITRGSETSTEGPQSTYPAERVGCQIGAGLIAAETHELTIALATAVSPSPTPQQARRGGFDYARWGTIAQHQGQSVGGMDNLQPLWMLKYLPNMLACHVTIIHGCEGPSNTHTNADASGLLSIGEGARVVERNAADVCICGSAESKLNLMGVLRMTLAGRYGVFGYAQDPASAVAPFDPHGSGSVPGEGGGLLILEERDAALRRGARIVAELAGFGAAHGLASTLPAPSRIADPAATNDGLVLAMRAALADAGIQPTDVDAIVPQACGVPALDLAEANALRAIFRDHLPAIELITLAPALGDASAGNGGLQAAAGALALLHQHLPARLGSTRVPPDLRAAPTPSRPARLRHVMVCSSSLGGQNAALILRAHGPERS